MGICGLMVPAPYGFRPPIQMCRCSLIQTKGEADLGPDEIDREETEVAMVLLGLHHQPSEVGAHAASFPLAVPRAATKRTARIAVCHPTRIISCRLIRIPSRGDQCVRKGWLSRPPLTLLKNRGRSGLLTVEIERESLLIALLCHLLMIHPEPFLCSFEDPAEHLGV